MRHQSFKVIRTFTEDVDTWHLMMDKFGMITINVINMTLLMSKDNNLLLDDDVITLDKSFIFFENEMVTSNDAYLDSQGIIFFTEI